MKSILIVLLLFIPFTVFGQCKVQFLIDDSCKNSVSSVWTEISLLDSVGTTIKRADGIFTLSTGLEAYVLITVIKRDRYMYLSWKFIVPEKRELIKIIKIPKLILMHLDESVQSESRYFYCNEICSGFCIDYYDNDQERIKGTFNDGISIGKQYTYYRDGKINYIAYYSSKGKFKWSKLYKYDNNGLLKEKVHYRNFEGFMNDLSPSQGGIDGFIGFDL